MINEIGEYSFDFDNWIKNMYIHVKNDEANQYLAKDLLRMLQALRKIYCSSLVQQLHPTERLSMSIFILHMDLLGDDLKRTENEDILFAFIHFQAWIPIQKAKEWFNHYINHDEKFLKEGDEMMKDFFGGI